MAANDTYDSSVARDNLIARDYPIMKEAVTIGASQTLARGAAVGITTLAAGDIVVGGSNTGNGVASDFALAAGGPAKLGSYNATAVIVDTDLATFNVTDPNGVLVGQAVLGTAFVGDGITFAIADGSTDFVVGDTFELPVEAGNGYGIACDIASTDGSQEIYGILLEAVTTGAGASQATVVAISGSFQTQALTFGGSTTAANLKKDARDKNMYFVTTSSNQNLIGG